jgi:hypothetical protein
MGALMHMKPKPHEEGREEGKKAKEGRQKTNPAEAGLIFRPVS